jgi:hypothetical protein
LKLALSLHFGIATALDEPSRVIIDNLEGAATIDGLNNVADNGAVHLIPEDLLPYLPPPSGSFGS